MTLLYLLPFLAALNGINLKISGFNIRLDQLGVVFLLFTMAAGVISGKIRFYLDKPGKLLLIFFLWSFVISLIFAPDFKYSCIQTINLLSSASVYFVLTNLLKSVRLINKYFKYFLLAGIFAISYGILIFILSVMGLNIPGANLIDDFSVAYGVFATMREPNIFGSFSLIYFILSFMIIISLSKSMRQNNHLVFLSFITSGLGLFLSFTRGVWLAACFGVLATFPFAKKIFKEPRARIKYMLSLSFVLVILFLFANFFVSKPIFYYKLSHFLDIEEGTGAGRLKIWTDALISTQESPFFGHGTYSFATLFPPAISEGQGYSAWIGNFLLTVLHDTGIMGTFIFLWMIIVLIKEGINIAGKLIEINPMNSAILSGVCLSLVCMLIAFIFTTGFSFVYAWSVLGLISVYVRYGKRELKITCN